MSVSTPNDYGLVLVRIAAGLVVLIHGLGKVGIGPSGPGSVSAFAGNLTSLGIPLPAIMAWVVTFVEIAGGLLLIVGFLTRVMSVLIAMDMFVASVVVHLPNGYLVSDGGYELTLTILLLAVSLVIMGPGRVSLEYAAFGRELVFETLVGEQQAGPLH